jgi:predicted RNA-binding protein with PUA-like domain
MPSKWLFKSDPETYSYDDLTRDGKTVWDGVSNNLALRNLRGVHDSDLILIYHTGEERAVVGIAQATSDPYPDPKQGNSKLTVVDLKAVERLARPVPLSLIKTHAPLRDFDLVRLPRLSVMPVSEGQWDAIMALTESNSERTLH